MADIPPGTYLRTSRNVPIEPAEESRIYIWLAEHNVSYSRIWLWLQRPTY